MWEPILLLGTALLRLSLPPSNQPIATSVEASSSGLHGTSCHRGEGRKIACNYGPSADVACRDTWGDGWVSVGYAEDAGCSRLLIHGYPGEAVCCLRSSTSETIAGGERSTRVHWKVPDDIVEPPRGVQQGQLTYGAPCYGGRGKTTACYYSGALGKSPDNACKETWGASFRSAGKSDTMCGPMQTSYCCIS